MKNVLQIQFGSKSAGSSAWRLHQAFTNSSYHSEVLSLLPDRTKREGVTYLSKNANLISKINNKLEAFLFKYDKEKYGLYSNPLIGSSLISHPSFKRADVVYIHWVQMGFLTLRQLEKIAQSGKRIIIVMHDMWWITGGCHNSINCEQYKTGCSACPIFSGKFAPTAAQVTLKKRILSYPNVSIITPSIWLKDIVKQSFIGIDSKVSHIPNFFDLACFKPDTEKNKNKDMSGENKVKLISFAAVNISSVYKGFSYLKKALEYLPEIYPDQEIEIQMIGSGNVGDLSTIPYKINRLGYLEEESEIAKAFAKSDLFVIPSIMENQPTVIIESLSCGVPVVGFKIGGIPDMIAHMENGYLAEPRDFKSLAEGIKYCLENNLIGYRLEAYQPQHVLEKHLSYLNQE